MNDLSKTNDNTAVSDEGETPRRLDQFLKFHGACSTGGMAKVRIQNGEVTLNGVVETRRKKQLSPGDIIALNGEEFVVA